MNILYVTPFYVPAYGFGGPVVVAHTIARQIAEQGHEVTVLTTDALDEVNRVELLHETLDGVRIHRFRNLLPNLAKNMNIYLPQGFGAFLKKHIAEFQIVHLHAFFTYLNILTIAQCRKQRIPYILHLHESPVPLPVLGKGLIKRVFHAFWGKRMLRDAAQIIVVSGRERDILVSYSPQLAPKILVVSNQVPEDLPKVSAKRSDFNLTESQKVILSLSRLSSIKRIDRILSALGLLVKKDTSYRLLIAGPDETGTKKKLEALVRFLGLEKYVQFLGPVDPEVRAKLFSIADLYVLLSAYESFSIATLEALFYQVPVCLSQEVGIASEIIPFGCGVMVEAADDPIRASQAIQETYQRREQLSINCRRALRSQMIEDYGGQFINLYTKLISAKDRS